MVAADCREGYEKALLLDPDLVLLDVRLNGVELPPASRRAPAHADHRAERDRRRGGESAPAC